MFNTFIKNNIKNNIFKKINLGLIFALATLLVSTNSLYCMKEISKSKQNILNKECQDFIYTDLEKLLNDGNEKNKAIAQTNTIYNGDSAIHFMCRKGNVDDVRFLIESDSIYLNLKNHNGEAPIDIACDNICNKELSVDKQKKSLEIFKFLLFSGAKFNIDIDNIDIASDKSCKSCKNARIFFNLYAIKVLLEYTNEWTEENKWTEENTRKSPKYNRYYSSYTYY